MAIKFGLTQGSIDVNLSSFINSLATFAYLMHFSLRDLEKAFILYSLTLTTGPNNLPQSPYSFYLAYVISLKIKHPDLFLMLIKESVEEGHKECAKFIERLITENSLKIPILSTIVAFHNAYVGEVNLQNLKKNGANNIPNSDQQWVNLQQYLNQNKIPLRFEELKTLFPNLLKQIDLSID